MEAYRDKVDQIAKCFLGYEVKYIPRDDNAAADMLSKLGSGRKPIPPGVFLGSRKLRHYFQENPMTVVSAAPLPSIMNNSDATGRVAKWGIELSAFDINYKARNAIKYQVIADFVADWTEAPEGTPMPEPEPWIMHFDESKRH